MKNKKSRARKISEILTMVLVPAITLPAIGGAIYYVVKNSRSIQKEFWSVEQFKKAAKSIKIQSEVIGKIEAEALYKDFKAQKLLSEKKMQDFLNSHPELKDNNISSYKKSKILKNAPKLFDSHEFISRYVDNFLDFTKTKFLDFKFVDLEKDERDSKKLKIHFEVYLNYTYANGSFELAKIRSTPESKYYYKSTQYTTFLSNELKTSPGTLFFNNWSTNEKVIKKIIQKYQLINKNIDKEIISKTEELEILLNKEDKNSEDINKISQVELEIKELKAKKDETFKTQQFQEEVFGWFSDVINKTEAYPDIYKKEEYKIMPLINDNNQYVSWNFRKRLNELTIRFKFVNIKNPKIESYGSIKIFTLEFEDGEK
ncbi:hypothetical protein DMC14_001635 [Metamycoplasma phocicerebrale]|uniref:Uncharacterized protein n=1 Tax=Metamycoplasma phocicerebrale TaxID=142649 RepID=A0A3Q9VBI3_9BACT|nr:hypothetical protein [Metamycoplasma phocicerebrale]AZZ65487.1 hypothetical protein DMC14_001635 [Metamycoplasma phocicerebrale]